MDYLSPYSYKITMSSQPGLSLCFGRVLRNERRARGISQEQLAADAGLDRTFVSLIERGKRRVTLETVASIAGVLGVTPAHLVELAELGEEDIAPDAK